MYKRQGQGILIRDKNGKEELNSIRFTTPNEEHDILYTMSSGPVSYTHLF